jgi:gas vesicle protein
VIFAARREVPQGTAMGLDDLRGQVVPGTIACPGEAKFFEGDIAMSEDRQSSGFSWFLAGLGIGALIGVLYAPKSGRETREELISSAREGSEYLKQRSREAADQMNDMVDRSKNQVGEYVDRGKEYVERGRAQWDEFVSQGRQFVNDQTGKVSAAMEAGKQAYQNVTGTGTSPADSAYPSSPAAPNSTSEPV